MLLTKSDNRVMSDNGTRRDESQLGETELIPLEGATNKILDFLVKTASTSRGTNKSKMK